jgi:hypothetical protein
VHRLEREVGTRVEAAVRSDPYFDLIAEGRRRHLQAVELAETLTRRGLHLFNLPAGSDIRRLREQLTRMDRRLARMAKELAELDAAQREPGR